MAVNEVNQGKTSLHRAVVRLIDHSVKFHWWLRAKVDPEGTRRWKGFLDNACIMAHVHGMKP
jgi:hypothetical protein